MSRFLVLILFAILGFLSVKSLYAQNQYSQINYSRFTGENALSIPSYWDFGQSPGVASTRLIGYNDFRGNLEKTENRWSRYCNDPNARRPILEEINRYGKGFKEFYSRDNLLNFSIVLGIGGILANTSLDDDFHKWYRKDVRSSGTSSFLDAFKDFGDGRYFVPVMLVASVGYRWIDAKCSVDFPGFRTGGDFCSRTARAYAVGAPLLLTSQYVLGGSRPYHEVWGSDWRLFDSSNSVSGHAFIGAIPFITAAEMTDNLFFKGLLYVGSTFTAWQRIDDDAHYLSQSIIGWYIAYLSCRSVLKSDGLKLSKGLTVFPLIEPDSTGITVQYRW